MCFVCLFVCWLVEEEAGEEGEEGERIKDVGWQILVRDVFGSIV